MHIRFFQSSFGTGLGHQSALDLTCTPNGYFLLRAECTWFSAGGFVEQAGPRKDILFGGATVQFTC
jgi:hypothetical protein